MPPPAPRLFIGAHCPLGFYRKKIKISTSNSNFNVIIQFCLKEYYAKYYCAGVLNGHLGNMKNKD